jgi:uncharacterized membrane protein
MEEAAALVAIVLLAVLVCTYIYHIICMYIESRKCGAKVTSRSLVNSEGCKMQGRFVGASTHSIINVGATVLAFALLDGLGFPTER